MSFDTEACGARIRELRKGNKLTQEGNTAVVNAISKTDTKEENTDEYSGK